MQNADPLQLVPHTGTQWSAPQFIALSPVERDGYSGILLVRLSDGIEQFIAGDWNVNFSPQGTLYAFGYFPDGYSSQTGQQVYVIESDNITDITVSGIDGNIASIRENALGTYMLIEVVHDDVRTYCLTERDTNQTPVCTQLTIPDGGTAQWNPFADHEVVIQNGVGQILLYDPWNPGFRDVSADDHEQLNALNALFTEPVNEPRTIYNFANLAVVKQGGAWHWLRIPWFAKIAWLADQTHLLASTQDQLIVIDTVQQTYSEVIPYTEAPNLTVQFYDQQAGFK
jgi:hypothetical protein